MSVESIRKSLPTRDLPHDKTLSDSTTTSVSPERFFSRVGLVQTDLSGTLLETTMIDLMWAKQVP